MAEKSDNTLDVSELAAYHKIPEGFLYSQCTDEHIKEIAIILRRWELVAYHLGLKEVQVEAIDRDAKSEEEKRLKCLMTWKESQSFKATYRKLLEALVKLGMADLASNVCQLCLPKPKMENKAPFCNERGSYVVDDDVAYFSSFDQVYSYNTSSKEWNTPPATLPQWGGSLVVVRGQLTYIGGMKTSNNKRTNKLVTFSSKLVRGKVKGEWVKSYPPMSVCRGRTVAVTYQDNVIVVGGTSTGLHKDNLDIVEVLNTHGRRSVWSRATSLPHPLSYASATIVSRLVNHRSCGYVVSDSAMEYDTYDDDHLYILGGNDTSGKCLSVFSCSLPELLWSDGEWERLTDLPNYMYYSTCSSVDGELLAVGGCDADLERGESKKTTAICKYNPRSGTWSVAAHMAMGRAACYVVPVPSERGGLLVVGGHVGNRVEATDNFELVSIYM